MKYVSTKSNKTIEIEPDFDPQTGIDNARAEAIAKGWKPVHTVVSTKSNKTIDVDDDGLDEAFSKGWQLPQVVEAQKSSAGISPVTSAARSYVQNVSGGFADEIAGAGAAMTGGDYTKARDDYRMTDKYAAQDNPKSSMAGGIAGGVAAGVMIPGGTLAKSIGQGAVQGLGMSEEDSALGIAKDGAIGGSIGGALYGAGSGISAVYDKLKQNAIKAGKFTASKFASVSPENIDRYLERAPQVNAARDVRAISDDLVKGGGDLAKKVSESSGRSFKVLDEADVSVPKAQISRMLDEKMNELQQRGLFTPAAQRDLKALENLKAGLNSVEGDTFTGPQAKNLLQQYGDLAYPTKGEGAAEITPILQRGIRDLRGTVNDNLKETLPAYGTAMKETADLTQTLKNIKKSVATPEIADSKVNKVLRGKAPRLEEKIKSLDSVNGTDLLGEMKDLTTKQAFAKPDFNGSRNVMAGQSILGALGAAAGYMKDTVAKPVTKKALDIAMKVEKSGLPDNLKSALVKAAQKGPTQFLLTHELLLKSNEEYRKATSN